MIRRRAILTFSPQTVKKPITYLLIKRFDIIVNILQARVFPAEEGLLIIEMQNEDLHHILEGVAYLESEGVGVRLIERSINCDRDRCTDCGACTGVCKAGALTLDHSSWELLVDQEKCLLCEMCISACPVRALRLEN